MVEYDYVTKKRDQVDPLPERGIGLIRFFMRQFSKLNVTVYRCSGGRLMNRYVGGFPVCIITTKGAKSGARRRFPLIHLPLGEKKLLVASMGGMDKMPSWYYNIAANPEVQIMVDGAEKTYNARRVSDQEKATLWPHICSLYPEYDEYQARTDRNIPVFECTEV